MCSPRYLHEVENYANIETQKVATWARNNKTSFNDQKSKVLVITKKKPKNKRDIRIFLNNKILQQTDTLKYLGITTDRRFNFNQHIENITGKGIKTVYSLSKSAKINWGLKHEVLRIINNGAILPILAYGAPVWIECINLPVLLKSTTCSYSFGSYFLFIFIHSATNVTLNIPLTSYITSLTYKHY